MRSAGRCSMIRVPRPPTTGAAPRPPTRPGRGRICSPVSCSMAPGAAGAAAAVVVAAGALAAAEATAVAAAQAHAAGIGASSLLRAAAVAALWPLQRLHSPCAPQR